MKKINFENLPSTKTPINATNLNLLQSNIEEVFDGKSSMGTISVDDIECKNLFTGWIIGKGIDNTTGAITTNANAGSTDYIPVDFNKNNDYILSRLSTNFRTFVAAYNLNKEFLGRTGANFVDSISLKSTSFPNGTPQGTGDITYIKIVTYNPIEGDIKQVKDVKPQLEKGSVATEYTPCKYFGYESGFNENGSWIKYDDGRLECYGVLDKTSFLSTQEFSQTVQNIVIYRSGAPEIIFPHKFIDTNITINITPQTATGTNYTRFVVPRISNIEKQQVEIQLLGLESWLENGIGYQYLNSVHYVAYGRWK